MLQEAEASGEHRKEEGLLLEVLVLARPHLLPPLEAAIPLLAKAVAVC